MLYYKNYSKLNLSRQSGKRDYRQAALPQIRVETLIGSQANYGDMLLQDSDIL